MGGLLVEMSCFVLEVETGVLVKTEDEGHFLRRECVHWTERGVIEALFFCLTCCRYFTIER